MQIASKHHILLLQAATVSITVWHCQYLTVCYCVLQAPLLLWVMAVIVIFGVSYQQLQGLQGPLASLNTMAHVTYRSSRVRLYISMLGMSQDVSECGVLRDNAKKELGILRQESETLLYGGNTVVLVSDIL